MEKQTVMTNVKRISWETFAKVAQNTWFDHFSRMRADPEYASQVRNEVEDAKN